MPDGAATSNLYLPKLITTFREGYGLTDLRHDATAGLTVAILALPLSMAIAVASGLPPGQGLYAAIVGGLVVSTLGGSRFQIGGPAGAFILLVAATVSQFGLSGLALTVLMSGAMLVLIGVLRLGSLIRHVPHAVVVGFTAGIAVTIAASQIKDFAGLTAPAAAPGPLPHQLATLAAAWTTFNPGSLAIGFGVAAAILVLRHYRPSWPGMLLAIVAASLAAALLHMPVETIGGRFGGIPNGLPPPHLPAISWDSAARVLPAALAFTLLGALESLLSAKVGDGLTGRVHRSNMELVAQGVANTASAVFGGMPVTGTVARTAANIRAGARSPVAGVLHALFLLLFMVFAAPVASFVPLAGLAGILVVVAWNMAEPREFGRLLRNWRAAAVLLTTFGLTVAHDLITGIAAGCALAIVFWGARRLREMVTRS